MRSTSYICCGNSRRFAAHAASPSVRRLIAWPNDAADTRGRRRRASGQATAKSSVPSTRTAALSARALDWAPTPTPQPPPATTWRRPVRQPQLLRRMVHMPPRRPPDAVRPRCGPSPFPHSPFAPAHTAIQIRTVRRCGALESECVDSLQRGVKDLPTLTAQRSSSTACGHRSDKGSSVPICIP